VRRLRWLPEARYFFPRKGHGRPEGGLNQNDCRSLLKEQGGIPPEAAAVSRCPSSKAPIAPRPMRSKRSCHGSIERRIQVPNPVNGYGNCTQYLSGKHLTRISPWMPHGKRDNVHKKRNILSHSMHGGCSRKGEQGTGRADPARIRDDSAAAALDAWGLALNSGSSKRGASNEK
jgi:hypothetical protein